MREHVNIQECSAPTITKLYRNMPVCDEGVRSQLIFQGLHRRVLSTYVDDRLPGQISFARSQDYCRLGIGAPLSIQFRIWLIPNLRASITLSLAFVSLPSLTSFRHSHTYACGVPRVPTIPSSTNCRAPKLSHLRPTISSSNAPYLPKCFHPSVGSQSAPTPTAEKPIFKSSDRRSRSSFSSVLLRMLWVSGSSCCRNRNSLRNKTVKNWVRMTRLCLSLGSHQLRNIVGMKSVDLKVLRAFLRDLSQNFSVRNQLSCQYHSK